MVQFTPERVEALMNAGTGRRIMVVGDLMIDRYLWGHVSRISPEAPVPIINIADEEIRFGGAANVVNNLIELQAVPVLVGTVGNDSWGGVFRDMLAQKDLSADGLISDPARPTTLKTRIIGNNQHIARVDREKVAAISPEVQQEMLGFITGAMPDIDAVILQDYNKGVMQPALVQEVIRLANMHGKQVTVDPKFDNFFSYRDVTVFKPNKKETEEALAIRLDSEANIRKAGEMLLERLNARAALITLGDRGMALFEDNGSVAFEGTHARQVADVSGAGDTVIAAITFALAAGATMKEAVAMANRAAGVVCEEVGVVPIRRDQLIRAILQTQEPTA